MGGRCTFLPGEVWQSVRMHNPCSNARLDYQKSAEAIVIRQDRCRLKGRTLQRYDHSNLEKQAMKAANSLCEPSGQQEG